MVTADAVLGELAKACDDRARPATGDDQVGGVPARFVARPASTAEAAEVLQVAAQHDLAVVARGGATKLGWGAAPRRLDLVLETTAISGVVEHNAGDLVVVVRAGTSLDELAGAVAGAGQELAFDSALRGATVGGSLATAPSSPRRLLRGTLRDLLIGVTFVRADGVVAKAGGKVVKNVAGYDFGKLLTGSYGTLGIVTVAVFRLHPRPAAARVVRASCAEPGELARAAHAVLASQTAPSAVEVYWPAEGAPELAVLLEGTRAGVDERAATVQLLLDVPSGDGALPAWWAAHPFGRDDVGLKLTCAVDGLGRLLAAARSAAAAAGLPVRLAGSAAGVVHAGLPAGSPAAAVGALLRDLRDAAASYDGSVVVLTAPAATRDSLDVWGPVAGLALMRRLKDEMDPGHRLAPGRFVGGI